jgi:exonuclease III
MKIATWNMDYWHHRPTHKQAWDYFLNQTEADLFLFQEGRPTEDMQDDEKLIWREIGGRRDWGSGIYSPTFKLVEERIKTGFTGEFVIGNAKVNDQELTLISLYGLMESDGPTKGYSIPNLHRMLSDLTGLFNGHIGGRRNIIMTGDLNASTQLDTMQHNKSHEILFDRIRDFGLRDAFELSGNKNHVQTLRHSRSKMPWQNDYCFVSKSLEKKYVGYEIKDTEDVRRFSDHNVLIVEIDC